MQAGGDLKIEYVNSFRLLDFEQLAFRTLTSKTFSLHEPTT
ncbi:hypothetical protein TSAR_002261 [Trichomalopsis sarcophagae]|uniref:Uncharacterized protein n=1 Tax=Trichomalopsis sarcophagae TaxID=543379 RepID=A0A232ENP8_9HYME|nr:hypothetical protein TSAR_002261 [Trichomalopsis sarcophagae]